MSTYDKCIRDVLKWLCTSLLGIGALILISGLVGGLIFLQQIISVLDTTTVERVSHSAATVDKQSDLVNTLQVTGEPTRHDRRVVSRSQTPEEKTTARSPVSGLQGRYALEVWPSGKAAPDGSAPGPAEAQLTAVELSAAEQVSADDQAVAFTTVAEARQLLERRTDLDEVTREVLLAEYEQALQDAAEVEPDGSVPGPAEAQLTAAELSAAEQVSADDQAVAFTTVAEARQLLERRTDLDEVTREVLLAEYEQALQDAGKAQ